MASISLHGGRWQARVRRQGYPTQTRSFTTKQDAEKWARSAEVAMDRGNFESAGRATSETLGDLIDRYVREVTPTLKSQTEDTIRLKAMMRHRLCRYGLAALTPARIADFRDERLKQVGHGTVIRELAYLSAIINHGRKEWGINMDNPVSRVRKPTPPPGRDRCLSDIEQDRLMRELSPQGRRNIWMQPLVELALLTGMRRGELLALRWEDVNFVRRAATLHDSKNGEGRQVPLSSRASAVLQALPRSLTGAAFPTSSFTVSAAFRRAVSRAGLPDLRFHDLRHTAITRLANRLPNVIELAAVSGHKSLRMLARYYHPRAEDLAQKLG